MSFKYVCRILYFTKKETTELVVFPGACIIFPFKQWGKITANISLWRMRISDRVRACLCNLTAEVEKPIIV